MPLKWPNKLHY